MSITPRTAWLRAHAGRHVAALVILVLIAVSIFEAVRPVWIPNVRHTASVGFTEFFSSTANPINIAQGPDGRMYYVGSESVIVGVNLDGTGPTEYSPSATNCIVHDLAAGPDGAIWYTEPGCNQIGRMTPAGIATEYPLPVTLQGSPWDIVQGTDLNMWFTLRNNCSTGSDCPASIGRIKPSDFTVSIFTTPTRFGNPTEITVGGDGNVWFTEPGGSMIAKADALGNITEYPVIGSPTQIAQGFDGRLWFSGGVGNTYGLMNLQGLVVATYTYPVGAGGSYLTQDLIGFGADQNVWFSATRQDNALATPVAVLGTIDPTGFVRDFQLPPPPNSCCSRLPAGMAFDNLNQVWYTDTDQTLIGHTSPIVSTIPPKPTPPSQRGGGSPSTSPTSQCQHPGQPVNCASGELWHRFVDLSVKGRGLGLILARTYSSQLASQDGQFGFGWTYNYNMALSIAIDGSATVHEEGGSAITFAPNGSGGYQAPNWVFASLVKNSDGTYTFRRKDQTSYTFNAGGQLIQEQDRNHNATSLAYNGTFLSTVTDGAGRQMQFTYSGTHIVRVTDPIQRMVSYQYDSSGNLIAVTDVGGGVTKFTYDSGHLQLTTTDPNGGVVTNIYDSAGRVIRQTDAMNRTTAWTYGSGSTSIIDPKGNVTMDNFQDGQLVSLTKGFGTAQAATWTLGYDQTSFALTSITDPNGHATTYTVDARSNELSATNALGQTTKFTWDNLNDPTSITDPMGATTQFSYDASGNVTSVTLPGNAVTAMSYDALHPGDLVAITDPDGNIWHLTYDQFGNVVRSVDPIGNVSTATFDQGGRETTSITPKGNVPGANSATYTTSYTYNAFNKILSSTDPLGHSVHYQYDPLQNLTGITDENGHPTSVAYDADNEPLVQNRTDGTQLKNVYDADGNLVAQVDPLGHATTYAYDPLNRLVSITDPLGRTTSVAYDGAGNITSRTDANGKTASFTHDAANRPTGIAFSDGVTPNVSVAYDSDGRRVMATDGTGTSTYAYDPVGRLTRSINGAGSKVSYAYDLNGNQTSITYPDGSQVTKTFDADGRLAGVTDWLGHRTTFAYDPNGNVVTQVYPNGIGASFSYDAADRLTKITDSGPKGQVIFTEGRDAAGQLTSENVQGEPPGGPVSYGYDTINRVISANYGIVKFAYQYDAADHLTAASATSFEGSVAATFSYDAADELLKSTQTSGSAVKTTQFTYDLNGNRIRQVDSSGGTTTYGYDGSNRLTSYNSVAHYAYNTDGLRMSKSVGGVLETFTWDISGPLPVLIQDGSTRYVTGVNRLPLEQVNADGTIRYYHQDALGSTRALTTASGQLDSVYIYDPYGNVAAFSGSKTPNPLQYAGEYRDAESGLIYLRARYYDPRTGQFISRDPIAPRTREPYAYAYDNPVNGRDPLGLDSNVGCSCLVYDLSHPNPVDILRDSAQAAFEYVIDAFKEGGARGVARLAGFAGRFLVGIDYFVAVFNAFTLYSDVHDADLHAWGVAESIYVQMAAPSALAAFGALAGFAITAETGPGAIVGTLVGLFGGAVVGGIIGYLMDTFAHCLYVAAERQRHRQKQTAGP